MYARSTTIQAQPSSIEAGIAHIRDAVMPALTRSTAAVGLSLLVDRESGRCIATTAWENQACDARQCRTGAPATRSGGPDVRRQSDDRRMGDRGVAPRPPLRSRRLRAGHLAAGAARPVQPGHPSSTGSRCCPRSKSSMAFCSAQPDDRPCLVAGGVRRRRSTASRRCSATRSKPVHCGPPGCATSALTSTTSASSNWRSRTCGCPSWSSCPCRSARHAAAWPRPS